MIEETFHGMLVQKKEGMYTLFVFQKDNNEYIMCTKLPNWGPYIINVGDSGFVTVDTVSAGEEYYDRESGETVKYMFSNIYFKEFIKDKERVEDIRL